MRTEGKRQPCAQARDRGLGGSRLSALHPDLQPRALAAPHRARSHIVGTAARPLSPDSAPGLGAPGMCTRCQTALKNLKTLDFPSLL